MTEPDVAITDFLLALESLLLAALLIGAPDGRADLRLWFGVFFVATAVAAALGGTVHGFFMARPSRLGRVLWRGSLIAIGIVAAAAWMIATAVLWGDTHAGRLTIVAMAFVLYAIVVMAVSDAFWIAIAGYLPSTLFLIVAYATAYRSDPNPPVAIGLAGLLVTLAASAGQRLRVGIHPVYFNHNALYHALQGIALFMIFWSGRYLIRA